MLTARRVQVVAVVLFPSARVTRFSNVTLTLLGLPYDVVLEKYQLYEFMPLVESIRTGDLRTFNDGLLKYQDLFIRYVYNRHIISICYMGRRLHDGLRLAHTHTHMRMFILTLFVFFSSSRSLLSHTTMS